jgi:FtsH-binding integral membrane protein
VIVPPTALAIVLPILGLFLLAMIGVVYVVLGVLPPSPSGDPQLFAPPKQNEPSTQHIPSKVNRALYAIFTGVTWFSLWVLFTRAMSGTPGDKGHRNILAEAFAYATTSMVVAAVTVWCARWLWRRFGPS